MSRILQGSALSAGSRVMLAALAAVMLLSMALVQAHPASAGLEWCWDDPVMLVDGKTVNINIGVAGSPETVRQHVQNAHTVLYLPPDVPAKLLYTTNQYFNETVEIRRDSHLKWVQPRRGEEKLSKVDFEAYISFSATKELPAQAQVIYNGKELAKKGDTTRKIIKVKGSWQ